MTDDQLVELASEFRAGLLGDMPSRMMCAAVCMPLSSLLRVYGVENEGDYILESLS